MSTMRDLADDCMAALVEAFPIEDVWLLEAKAAKECELESPINLFLIVPDVSEAHAIESAALEMVRKRPECEWHRRFRFSPFSYYEDSAASPGKDGSDQR
jgi:hypothetical protein